MPKKLQQTFNFEDLPSKKAESSNRAYTSISLLCAIIIEKLGIGPGSEAIIIG